jgi:hypothetical protein
MVGLEDDSPGGWATGHHAGPSSTADQLQRNEDHDYTENASAADIAQAIEQQREEEKALIGQNMEGAGPGDSGESLSVLQITVRVTFRADDATTNH